MKRRGTLGCLVLFVLAGLVAFFTLPTLIAGPASTWLAFIATFALGLIYLAISDLHTTVDAALNPPGLLKPCPHCAERVKVEARACRFCGRDLA